MSRGMILIVLVTIVGLLAGLHDPSIRYDIINFSIDEQHSMFINAMPFSWDVPANLQDTDNDSHWFRHMDINHDHVLTLKKTLSGIRSPELDTLHDRFIRLTHRFQHLNPNRPLPKTFLRMDANRDNHLSVEEFIEATRWMRLSVATLARMDKDHNNRITHKEFQGAPLTKPFILGTDNMGRDIFSRLLDGLLTSALLALIAGLSAFFIGLIYGMIAGYVGGSIDAVMMRLVDVVYGLPYILMVVILVAIRGPGFVNLVLAVLIVQWLPVARTVRSLVVSAREQEFVLASKGMGSGRIHILFRHILPRVIHPSFTLITVLTPNVIRQEVLLSFLGLGITPPTPSMGSLIADGLSSMGATPLPILWPSLVLIGLLMFLQSLDRPSKKRF